MSKEGIKKAECQYRQFSFDILFFPWSVSKILRALLVQCLNTLTSGDLSPVKTCLRPQVVAFQSWKVDYIFWCLVVILPCGLPIREAKVILLQVWKAKGNLEQHLLDLCWLDKSFSQMWERLTIFRASKNHTTSLHKQRRVLLSVPHVQ